MNVKIVTLLAAGLICSILGAQTCDDFISRGEYETAIGMLEKSADDNNAALNNRAYAFFRAGLIYLRNLGDYQKAQEMFEKSVKLSPDDKHIASVWKDLMKEVEKLKNTPVTCKYNFNKSDAIFKNGEDVVLTVRFCGKNADDVKFVKYTTFLNGKISAPEILPVENRIFRSVSKPPAGSWMMFEVAMLDKDKKTPQVCENIKPVSIGALVDPYEIKEAVKAPDDFVEFWQKQRQLLSEVPLKTNRTEIASDIPNVQLYDVKVDCSGPAPVSGCLSIPANAKEKSLPAVVTFHGAGVSSADKPKPWEYPEKAIIFDINAHGLDNFKPLEFYLSLNNPGGKLHQYYYMNKDNKDAYYMKDLIVRVMRALDYVKSLPEWDRKNLIAFGGSQGGMQSLVGAALDSDVTLCISTVTAMGDLAGFLAGRQQGWAGVVTLKDGEYNPKELECSGYYDMKNFAQLVKCETYIATGFVDTACSPTSVFLIYNSLPKNIKKAMSTAPDKGHNASNNKGFSRFQEVLQGGGTK